jgi:hypothetical protein
MWRFLLMDVFGMGTPVVSAARFRQLELNFGNRKFRETSREIGGMQALYEGWDGV